MAEEAMQQENEAVEVDLEPQETEETEEQLEVEQVLFNTLKKQIIKKQTKKNTAKRLMTIVRALKNV
jgi:hypothetical protein